MKCSVGCSERISPAIGVANLEGVPGTATAGTAGSYPLCFHHIEQIRSGNWDRVKLLGWEEFPHEIVDLRRPDSPESIESEAEQTRSSPAGDNPIPAPEPDPEII